MAETTEEAYEVESIVGHRKLPGEPEQYLVRWVGYENPTWEPIGLLDNCKNLIKEFWIKKKEKAKQATEQVATIKPPTQPDFRMIFNLPIDTSKENIQELELNPLEPKPQQREFDADIEPTNFHDMQVENVLLVRREPKKNVMRSWYSGACVTEVDSDEKFETPPNNFRITSLWKDETGECFGTITNQDEEEEIVEYDTLAFFFPDLLADFIELHYLIGESIS
ncbi:chromodomain Y-like protein [Histomonas meleagridis]|uniref:chromodomain Y-like protein n=1 Tax=Histomonas meleagridis TaxID=135588 RepID=UPI00355A8FE2|nr:chromodomain Y-like protein [Histomonas meleagridis]KAH0806911.1 chromodomain Y-like protein [Histomonas meleagridis]